MRFHKDVKRNPHFVSRRRSTICSIEPSRGTDYHETRLRETAPRVQTVSHATRLRPRARSRHLVRAVRRRIVGATGPGPACTQPSEPLPCEGEKESRHAGGTACATTASAVVALVGQAVSLCRARLRSSLSQLLSKRFRLPHSAPRTGSSVTWRAAAHWPSPSRARPLSRACAAAAGAADARNRWSPTSSATCWRRIRSPPDALTNPTHPMWGHFESMHILQHPTYAAMYHAAQGLILAAGSWCPVIPGPASTSASPLMCALLCWMLQGWLPRVGSARRSAGRAAAGIVRLLDQ